MHKIFQSQKTSHHEKMYNDIIPYALTKCDFLLVKPANSIYQLAGTGQTQAVSFIQPLLRAEPLDFSKNQHNSQANEAQKC